MLFNLHKNRIRCHHTTSGFAKLGGGVITQTVAGTKTVGDSPNGAQLTPQLRKAADALYVSGQIHRGQKLENE